MFIKLFVLQVQSRATFLVSQELIWFSFLNWPCVLYLLKYPANKKVTCIFQTDDKRSFCLSCYLNMPASCLTFETNRHSKNYYYQTKIFFFLTKKRPKIYFLKSNKLKGQSPKETKVRVVILNTSTFDFKQSKSMISDLKWSA